jgi:hypothetical protein
MSTNPYTPEQFPWGKLLQHEQGIVHKILSLASARVLANTFQKRRSPEFLRKILPKMPINLDTLQTLVIERTQHRIEGQGPQDTLTVTFSDVVRRGNSQLKPYLDSFVEEAIDDQTSDAESSSDDLPLDAKDICAKVSAEMDHKQTWTDVSKIRLVRKSGHLDEHHNRFSVELVWPGNSTPVPIPDGFLLSNEAGHTSMYSMTTSLLQGLNLRESVALSQKNRVYEYTIHRQTASQQS